jgi:hypothetical protein
LVAGNFLIGFYKKFLARCNENHKSIPGGLATTVPMKNQDYAFCCLLTEEFRQPSSPIVKDPLQHVSHPEFVNKSANDAVGELIEDPVQHPGLTAREGLYQVLVVPEPIWPKSLFIDKKSTFPDVFDLGQPATSAKQGDPNFVKDYQPIVHCPGDLRQDLKVQLRRSQFIEIERCRQKLPGLVRDDIEDHFSFDAVHVSHFYWSTRTSFPVSKSSISALATSWLMMPSSS